jgi:hypothetical protein
MIAKASPERARVRLGTSKEVQMPTITVLSCRQISDQTVIEDIAKILGVASNTLKIGREKVSLGYVTVRVSALSDEERKSILAIRTVNKIE